MCRSAIQRDVRRLFYIGAFLWDDKDAFFPVPGLHQKAAEHWSLATQVGIVLDELAIGQQIFTKVLVIDAAERYRFYNFVCRFAL